MSFIDYQAKVKILVMTKGHPFNRDDFFSIFDKFEGVEATAVEQPASQIFFQRELALQYSAFVFYDMPGMDFRAKSEDDGLAPEYVDRINPGKVWRGEIGFECLFRIFNFIKRGVW